MIKNLSKYRNRWSPKYYHMSSNVIFNVSSTNDADNCGIQVVDVTKIDDELGQEACDKACGIVMEFKVSDETKHFYFPMQSLISDGDLIMGDESKYFVQAHPEEFADKSYYLSEFLKPIDDEIINQAASGKKMDGVFNALPAWLTTPTGTENISINDFIKGSLKIYDNEVPDGIEIGKLLSVKFYYWDSQQSQHKVNLNNYTEEVVEEIFKAQIALMGIKYINNKLNKQLNSKLSETTTDSIKNMAIEPATGDVTNSYVAVTHMDGTIEVYGKEVDLTQLEPSEPANH